MLLKQDLPPQPEIEVEDNEVTGIGLAIANALENKLKQRRGHMHSSDEEDDAEDDEDEWDDWQETTGTLWMK